MFSFLKCEAEGTVWLSNFLCPPKFLTLNYQYCINNCVLGRSLKAGIFIKETLQWPKRNEATSETSMECFQGIGLLLAGPLADKKGVETHVNFTSLPPLPLRKISNKHKSHQNTVSLSKSAGTSPTLVQKSKVKSK